MADIHVTEHQITAQEAELRGLLEQIRALQSKAQSIERWLEAARVLASHEPLFSSKAGPSSNVALAQAARVPAYSANIPVTDFIVEILEKADHPLTKKELRSLLLDAGMPKERLGKQFGYFYTTIGRLTEQNRIICDGDRYRVSPNGTGAGASAH